MRDFSFDCNSEMKPLDYYKAYHHARIKSYIMDGLNLLREYMSGWRIDLDETDLFDFINDVDSAFPRDDGSTTEELIYLSETRLISLTLEIIDNLILLDRTGGGKYRDPYRDRNKALARAYRDRCSLILKAIANHEPPSEDDLIAFLEGTYKAVIHAPLDLGDRSFETLHRKLVETRVILVEIGGAN